MAKNSNIEWTHDTFNPWWGCSKVSPACKNCYAESWALRVGLSVWGEGSPRRFFGSEHWREPLTWNRRAEAERKRRRVFCASMADVFEDRRDLDPWRRRLWCLVENTPWLDWLFLTKRPEYIGRFAPWRTKWPRNVWLGTTVEIQGWAIKRIPTLLQHPAAIRFLSCEPLLGPLDLRRWLPEPGQRASRSGEEPCLGARRNFIDWVIAGGESGYKARPMNPVWAEDLRDQCTASGVPFHFKQWGHWRPSEDPDKVGAQRVRVSGRNGIPVTMVKLGKKAAGRDLAGQIWDEVPEPGEVLQR